MKYWKWLIIVAVAVAWINVGMWNDAYAKSSNGKGKGQGVSQGGGHGKGHDKGNHSNDRGKGHGDNCGSGDNGDNPGDDDNDDNGDNGSKDRSNRSQGDSDRYKPPTVNQMICHCDYPLHYWFDERCNIVPDKDCQCDVCTAK
jgi:hypothetical protein